MEQDYTVIKETLGDSYIYLALPSENILLRNSLPSSDPVSASKAVDEYCRQ